MKAPNNDDPRPGWMSGEEIKPLPVGAAAQFIEQARQEVEKAYYDLLLYGNSVIAIGPKGASKHVPLAEAMKPPATEPDNRSNAAWRPISEAPKDGTVIQLALRQRTDQPDEFGQRITTVEYKVHAVAWGRLGWYLAADRLQVAIGEPIAWQPMATYEPDQRTEWDEELNDEQS